MRDDTAKDSTVNTGRLRLRAGRAELEVAPDKGGCITAFRWRNGDTVLDWLRPAPACRDLSPTESACFPLVPYSNRIRGGRFRFRGRDFRLTPNFPPSPHSIHGHGWQVPWAVAEAGEEELLLRYEHAAPDWPSSYRAEQRFALRDEALHVELAVTNLGRDPLPAGLGLHPYFPRSPLCRLSARVGRMWATDGEVMPTALSDPLPGGDPNQGLRPDDIPLDNCFTGFGGQATIHWPERRAEMVIDVDPALNFLVVFTPPGESYFCAEPVSHSTDAINLAGSDSAVTGMKILEPGERFAATTRFLPRLDAAS
jgi:aldose 1-epimerase